MDTTKEIERIKEILSEVNTYALKYTEKDAMAGNPDPDDLFIDRIRAILEQNKREAVEEYNTRLRTIRLNLNERKWHSIEEINQYLDSQLLANQENKDV